MTYSRPTTSTVDAFAQPAKAQPMPGVDKRTVKVSEEGRFIDKSSPAQAGKNAGRDQAAISAFLSNAIEIGAPLYKGYLQEQAQGEVAEFFRNTDAGALARTATADQRDLIKTQNPFARDMIFDAEAKWSARIYAETYAAESERFTALKDPTAPPEQKAAAAADVRKRARAASGINNLPGSAIAPYLGFIAETEASIQGDSYKAMVKAQSGAMDVGLENGIRADLKVLDEKRILVTQGPSAETANVYTGELAAYVKGVAAQVGKLEGFYTVEGYAERYAAAVVAEFKDRMGDDDLNGAMHLVNTLNAMTDTKDGQIKMRNGLSLWDIKIGDGSKTIRSMVDDLATQLGPAYEEWQRKEQIKRFGPDLVAAAQGDEGARGRITAMLPTVANDPQALGQVVGALGQMQSFARTPTEAQMRVQAGLEIELNNPNRDPKALNQRILASGMTEEQKISLLNRNNQPTDPTLALVSQGVQYVAPEVEAAAMAIVRSSPAAKGLDADGLKALAASEAQNLQIAASKATESRIKALQAAGETVTPMRAAEIARNETEAIRNSRLKESGQAPAPKATWDQQAMAEVNQVQQNLRAAGGVGSLQIFPQSVLDGARRNGVPLDYKNVQRYFLNRISTIKDPKGRPAFPDPQKAYRQMVEDAKPKGSGGPGPMSSIPTPGGIGGLAAGAVKGLGWVLQKGREAGIELTGGEKPQPQSKADPGKKPAPARPVASVPQQLLNVGLQTLAGVIAPPAAAATAPQGSARPAVGRGGELVNPEGMSAMASIWAGREPITPRTPPLPQVPANAPAQPIPLAINNVMHPIFVAIGIAEGTRTPAGGYTRAYYGHTDPGSGAHNVGTVSMQNGPNPVTADRTWMATLSRRAVQVAPILAQLGVPPATVAYNRLMFNVLDLNVQSPAALGDFIRKLPGVVRAGATIEAIAKARADSFFNPATGRLEAGGFGNSYSRLLADQRSRAGAFDYKRRL